MRRITINAVIDIGCLITFVPSLVSGLVLFFVLPSGGGRGGSHAVYLGLFRDQWLNMHNYWSFAFSALIIIHLILHWMYFWNIRKCFSPGKKEADTCNT
ncbi:MAG: DUF4405 domain-containing protein [Methanoregulaceae archaeon]|nr:MAG: DUF4405 domain-containing protein [Methanoregulaceae archaeon]